MYSAQQSILKALAYYDIFNYPLTRKEIISFLDNEYSESELNEAFNLLLNEKIIFLADGFYSLIYNPALVQRRKKGNERARKQLRTAEKVARLLSMFPYVRCIAVSGSLSKNFADKKSDVDLFIITAKNRLWIARSFMHLFKKLTYLAGKQNWFCMNYYVDEEGLEIIEKNVYTATEIVTLKPMYDDAIFNEFLLANKWYKKNFPCYTPNENGVKMIRKNFLRSFIEWMFNNRTGDKLDNWLMKVTVRRWKRKTEQEKKNSRGVLVSIDGGKHYSKPNPKYFQEKIVNRYNLKVEQLMQELEPFTKIQIVQLFNSFSEAK